MSALPGGQTRRGTRTVSRRRDSLRAGDRAPNATGLANLADSRKTASFAIFSPARHTALVFGRDSARIGSIVEALGHFRDDDGIAYEAYRMTNRQTFTVIVRPDGVVGAIVSGEHSVAKYFAKGILFLCRRIGVMTCVEQTKQFGYLL